MALAFSRSVSNSWPVQNNGSKTWTGELLDTLLVLLLLPRSTEHNTYFCCWLMLCNAWLNMMLMIWLNQIIGVACRSVVWQLCCCDEYTHPALKSFGRSFRRSHRRSWKREQLSAYRASRTRLLGKRSANVGQNLHVICWVSVGKQLRVLASTLVNSDQKMKMVRKGP